MSVHARRYAPQRPARRWSRPLLVTLVLLPGAALLVAVGWRALPGYTGLAWLELEGSFDQVSEQRIAERLSEHRGRSVVALDLRALEQALGEMGWVDRVRLRRIWPDGLHVDVREQQALARWGEIGLVNSRGEVFTVGDAHMPEHLPVLDGPLEHAAEVLATWREVTRVLERHEQRADYLAVDRRGSWRAVLGNGVELRLGPDDPVRQTTRFVRTGLPELADRMAEVAYVDLRYTNGFAVARRAARRDHDAAEGS